MTRTSIPVYSIAGGSTMEPGIAARVTVPCAPWEKPIIPDETQVDARIRARKERGHSVTSIAKALGLSKERVERVHASRTRGRAK